MSEYCTHRFTECGDFYNLAMIAALSFRVCTMESEAFRKWLLYRPQRKMIVVQVDADNRSAVELHDLPRKAQPDARAVGLGRVEGGKDIFGDLGRDRSPVVVELDDNSLRRG